MRTARYGRLRRRLDHAGGDREIDRHQEQLGGVEPVRLVGEKHLLCTLSDDAQGRLVHESDEFRGRREPRQPQSGNRRVVPAVRARLPLDRGASFVSSLVATTPPLSPGRRRLTSHQYTGHVRAGGHEPSQRSWRIRQESGTIVLTGPRCLGLPYLRLPEVGFGSALAIAEGFQWFRHEPNCNGSKVKEVRIWTSNEAAHSLPARDRRIGSPARFGSIRCSKHPSRARVAGASVTFEPGARTAWHTHPLGQTLIVTAGCGWAQRWGGPIEEIRPGDVIWFPPGEKHWHGATPTTAMTHIAIQEKLDGKVGRLDGKGQRRTIPQVKSATTHLRIEGVDNASCYRETLARKVRTAEGSTRRSNRQRRDGRPELWRRVRLGRYRRSQAAELGGAGLLQPEIVNNSKKLYKKPGYTM